MPSSELQPVDLAADLSKTKARTQGVERREGSPSHDQLVEINASHGPSVPSGWTMQSTWYMATQPIRFFEVALTFAPVNSNEEIQIQKNDVTVHTLGPLTSAAGNLITLRSSCGFKLKRNDLLSVYMDTINTVAFMQVTMRGTAGHGASGTLTFKLTSSG